MNAASPQTDVRRRSAERRAHPRIPLRERLEFRPAGNDATPLRRAITRDVSSGGVRFEADAPGPSIGTRLDLGLTLPAGDGVSPFAGRATCVGEVMRVSAMPTARSHGRVDVAVRFLERPKLAY